MASRKETLKQFQNRMAQQYDAAVNDGSINADYCTYEDYCAVAGYNERNGASVQYPSATIGIRTNMVNVGDVENFNRNEESTVNTTDTTDTTATAAQLVELTHITHNGEIISTMVTYNGITYNAQEFIRMGSIDNTHSMGAFKLDNNQFLLVVIRVDSAVHGEAVKAKLVRNLPNVVFKSIAAQPAALTLDGLTPNQRRNAKALHADRCAAYRANAKNAAHNWSITNMLFSANKSRIDPNDDAQIELELLKIKLGLI